MKTGGERNLGTAVVASPVHGEVAPDFDGVREEFERIFAGQSHEEKLARLGQAATRAEGRSPAPAERRHT